MRTVSSARQFGRNYARAREIRTSWAISSYRVQSLCAVSGTASVISALCLRRPFSCLVPPWERLAGLLHRNDYGATVFLPSRAACARSGKASRSHVVSVTPRSRSLYFCTLPLSVVGSSRTNSRYRGSAK
jgi:hypothetical protein